MLEKTLNRKYLKIFQLKKRKVKIFLLALIVLFNQQHTQNSF